jgi:hypothetical protein
MRPQIPPDREDIMQGWGQRARLGSVALIVGLALIGVTTSTSAAKPRYKATVISISAKKSGIGPGDVAVVDAKCPEGYAVFGGSYVIQNSVLAHAAGAAPFFKQGLYRAIIVNPSAGAFISPQNASVNVNALCGVEGRPLVVDGPYPGSPKEHEPPLFAGSVLDHISSATVPNGGVKKIDAKCGKDASVFGGGYTLDGALFADAAAAAALSKISAFSATVVNPNVNPALGVQESAADVKVAALCSEDGADVVLSTGIYPTPQVSAARPKLRKPPRGRATVIIKTATTGGIQGGEVDDAVAKCPKGYWVFGGSYLINGNSVLAHASVAAPYTGANEYRAEVVNPPPNINTGYPRTTASVTAVAQCAKRAQPIVVDGPFG